MAEAITILAAQAAAAAARPVMGLTHSPMVVNHDDHVSIEFDPELQGQVADFLIRQLDSEPGKIRVVGLAGVFLRVVLRKYGLWAAGALGVSFGAGRLTGGKRK